MPNSVTIPTNAHAARALGALLSYEAEYVAGTESLAGRLATGRHERDRDASSHDPEHVEELRTLAHTWPGPRGNNAMQHVHLSGEYARQLTEHDFGTPTGERTSIVVHVLTTGPHTESLFHRYPQHDARVFATSVASLPGEFDALRDQYIDAVFDEDPFTRYEARWNVAEATLLELAAQDVTTMIADLGGAKVSASVVGLAGRFFHGAARYYDVSATSADYFSPAATTEDLLRYMAPTIQSYVRDPSRTRHAIAQSIQQHPWLSPTTNDVAVEQAIAREHLFSVLGVAARFPAQLRDALDKLIASGECPPAITVSDIRNTMQSVEHVLSRGNDRGITL
jgi:hypothetical protein